jgi:hypothetical protein
MAELFDVRLNPSDAPFRQADLVDAVKKADVLVPTITDRIDAAVISQAGEQLKLIANFGNGVDNIDLVAATDRGITVTNTPGVLTADTADMTMALILAVPRRLADGMRVMESGSWGGWSPTWMLGHRILRLQHLADRAAGLRFGGGFVELRAVGSRCADGDVEMHFRDREAGVELFEGHGRARVDAGRHDTGFAEDHGQGHRKTAGMGGREQFFRIRAGRAFEARAEGVGSFR